MAVTAVQHTAELCELWHGILIRAVLDDEDAVMGEHRALVKESQCPLKETLVVRRIAEDQIEGRPALFKARELREDIAAMDSGAVLQARVYGVLADQRCRRLVDEAGRGGAARVPAGCPRWSDRPWESWTR